MKLIALDLRHPSQSEGVTIDLGFVRVVGRVCVMLSRCQQSQRAHSEQANSKLW